MYCVIYAAMYVRFLEKRLKTNFAKYKLFLALHNLMYSDVTPFLLPVQ